VAPERQPEPPAAAAPGTRRAATLVARAPAPVSVDAAGSSHPASRLRAVAADDALGRILKGHAERARGLSEDPEEEEIVRGMKIVPIVPEEPAPGGAGAPGPASPTDIRISTVNNAPPTWKPGGAFTWPVAFTTNARNGWIVQDIENGWRATDAKGAAVPSPFFPRYWEAWAVDGAGNVTPRGGLDNDRWTNSDLAATYGAVKGRWTTAGRVYFTTIDPESQGFVRRNPKTHAGILLATTKAPQGLGTVRLERYADGTWDEKGHTGRAGP